MGFQYSAVKSLLLIGSRSSRMREPKHLIPGFDGVPMFVKTLQMVQTACPDARTVYVSVHT